MDDMHEATFVWPEVDAEDVIVTGAFDQWSSSIHLTKTPHGFEGKVKLPWGDRVLYKFVVDGRWVVAQSQPEEKDSAGNVNNVYECPSKPNPPTFAEPPSDLPAETLDPKHNEFAAAPLTAVPDQQTLPEKASQIAQQVKETVITSTQEYLPGGSTSGLNQTHANVVVPIVEAGHKVVSDPAGALGQVKESIPTPVTDTAQRISETVRDTVVEVQTAVAPAVTPVVQTVGETFTDKTPEPVKEQENTTAEEVQVSASDPVNADKIPVATPTPTQGAFIVNPELGPDSSVAPASTAQPDVEPTFKDIQFDVETVPAATTSDPSETTTPATSRFPTITEHEGIARTVSDAIPTKPLDSPAGTADTDTVPSLNSTAAHEITHTSVLTPAPPPEPSHPTPASPITDPETTAEASAAVDPSTAAPVSDEPEATDNAQAEVNSVEELPPPTADTNKAITTDTSTTASVGASAAMDVPPVTPEVQSIEAAVSPSREPATSTITPVQPAEAALAPSVADNSANGHSPPIANSSSPEKASEASESAKPQGFPTSETKTTASTTSSPADSSKFGSTRKKRLSIFGKVKNLFHSDKEEKKERK